MSARVLAVRVDSADFAERDSSERAELVSVLVAESAGAEAGVRVVIATAVVIVAAAVSLARWCLVEHPVWIGERLTDLSFDLVYPSHGSR